MHRENLDRYVGFANELADAARTTLISMSEHDVQPIFKEDCSPVTDQDKAVERVMRQRITETFPEHGIYGEEYGSVNIDADCVWVLDPIDGTSAFMAGLPTYCTLISLCFEGRPILGLIDNIVTKCRWAGVDGRNSTLNGVPIKTRPCANLANAIITTYSPEMFRCNEYEVLKRIVSSTRLTVYGGNSFAYGRLAGGFIDLGKL